MYFDGGNESKIHEHAKEKLFDLIVCKRVKILDQHGNEHKVFTGEHDTEFLHIESFIMDYSNEAIFSNPNSPCRRYLGDSCCNGEGHYGAFREIPCTKNIINKFGEYMEGSSKYASFRADIAFGYEGKHKIWLEIKNTHPCTLTKISFCKEKGIILLEVNADDILKLDGYTNVLTMNLLEGDDYVKEGKSNTYDNVRNQTIEIIANHEYIPSNVLYGMIEEVSSERIDFVENISKLKLDLGLMEIQNYNQPLQNYFGTKAKIYIKREKYDYYLQYEKDYEINIEKCVEEQVNKMIDTIESAGYMMLKEYKDSVSELMPKGYKTKINKYDLKLDRYNRIFVRDIEDELHSLGIDINKDKNNRNGKVILSDKLYKQIQEARVL